MNVKAISESLAELGMLKYFPAGPEAQAGLLRMVCEMLDTKTHVPPEEQAEWLVKRTLALYNEWPGPRELRAVFCSRFRPADGIEATADFQRFPEGIPPDPTLRKLPESPRLQIERGLAATEDPELAAGFERLMAATTLPNPALSHRERVQAARFSKLLEATLTAPEQREDDPPTSATTPQIITQADVDVLLAQRKSRA